MEILGRIIGWVFLPFSFIWRTVDRLWAKKIKSVVPRMAATTVSSAFIFWIALFNVLPWTATLAYDAFAFNVWKETATMTFSKAEEMEDRPGMYRVYACRKTPCAAQIDSIEFHIRDSSYMDVVWLFTKQMPYDPGELAGAFLAQKNHCTIEFFGKRRKYFGTYPKIINAKCEQ